MPDMDYTIIAPATPTHPRNDSAFDLATYRVSLIFVWSRLFIRSPGSPHSHPVPLSHDVVDRNLPFRLPVEAQIIQTFDTTMKVMTIVRSVHIPGSVDISLVQLIQEPFDDSFVLFY